VSAVLPLKDSSRELIIEVTRALEPYFPDIIAKWREKIAQEFDFDGRILVALEQLQLAAACTFICGKNDFKGLVESLSYHGSRLAKLQVDTRAVARSFELYLNVCEPYVGSLFGERRAELMATLEAFSSACFVVVSGAYFDAKSEQNAALLSILDAELSAADLPSVFEQVLKITAKVFGASVGVLMLKEMGSNRLQARAKLGFDGDGDLGGDRSRIFWRDRRERRSGHGARPFARRPRRKRSTAPGRAHTLGHAAECQRRAHRSFGSRLHQTLRVASD
jgi:hypothetical protein